MGSGGKRGITVLVVAIVAVIAVAVTKPWAGPAPAPRPSPTPIFVVAPTDVPAPTQPGATQAGPTSLPQGPAVPLVDPISTIDWQAVGAALRPHDAWGIRTVVYRPDNTVREDWTPIVSSGTDVQAAATNADSYAILGTDGTILALGVTTPLGDLPLDVRAWRDTQATPRDPVGWRNLVVTGITPSGDPSSRLMRLPDDWSPQNAWPPGEYEVDILLETAVLHVHLWLDGAAGPIPAAPAPRPAPTSAQLRALAASPGGFVSSGTDSGSFMFVGLPATDEAHDERDAWAAVNSDHVFDLRGSLVVRQSPVLGTANVLGAVVDTGQVLLSARLSELSPQPEDLGAGEILSGDQGPAARPGAVAIFRAPAGIGFPDAVYRIDATVQTAHGNLAVSWDLPVLTRPTTTESPLLAADRDWSAMPHGQWAEVAPGIGSVPVPVSSSANLAPDPGSDCRGGAALGRSPQSVGVIHPGGAFHAVTVQNLSGAARGASVPIQVSQLAPGVVSLRPIGANWPAGRYAISMQTGATLASVTFCVA